MKKTCYYFCLYLNRFQWVKFIKEKLFSIKSTEKEISLKDFLQIKEQKIEGFIKSNSLFVVYHITHGKTISKDLMDYFLDENREDILIDILKRTPHEYGDIKKSIIDVLYDRQYFNENKLRDWVERFNGSAELTRYLLGKKFSKKP